MTGFRVVVAVEETPLREAIVDALTQSGTPAQVLCPDELLATRPDQHAFVVLNTGADVDRLISTAAALYSTWSALGFDLMIRTYSPPRLTSDNVVFRLWRVGPELTVTVGTYVASDPNSLRGAREEVVRFTRFLDESPRAMRNA